MISKPQSTLHSDGTKSVLSHLHVRDLFLLSPAEGSVSAHLTGPEELFLKATLGILWVTLAQGVRDSDCECMAAQLPLLPLDKSQLKGDKVLGMGLVSKTVTVPAGGAGFESPEPVYKRDALVCTPNPSAPVERRETEAGKPQKLQAS